jgi:hypothetical protein
VSLNKANPEKVARCERKIQSGRITQAALQRNQCSKASRTRQQAPSNTGKEQAKMNEWIGELRQEQK